MKGLIDPGHGGTDTGAFAGNVKESALNLRMAHLIAGYCVDGMAQNRILLTRYHDQTLVPDDRRVLIQEPAVDLFVCVHHNALNNPAIGGFESFILRDADADDVRLQAAIHAAVAPVLAEYGMPDRGAKRMNMRVLTEKTCPGVFLEVGFLTGPEYATLIDREFQAKFAASVAAVMREFKREG